LKLATWNVERPVQRRRREALLSHIHHVAADLWVLTETHDDLRVDLPYVHSSMPGRDGTDDDGHRWVSIWSRHPIQPLSASDEQRTAAALVTIPDCPSFIVFGSVLPWTGSQWQGHAGKGGIAFSAALACQLGDWRRIRRDFPEADLFLAGDLNQDLAPSHYYGSRANRAALESALNEVGLVALTAGDDDPVWREAAPRASIDHICATIRSRWNPGLPIRWHLTPAPPRTLSDHFGVAVDFTLRGSETRCLTAG
jgi:hypothetical protein